MDIKNWMPEFKVSAEDDTDLMSYFVKTKYIEDIILNKKWMVLGRKGTGKTAIYEYFNSDNFISETNIVVPLNFKDYPWPIHRLYKESMEGELNAYFKSWNYLFVTQALTALITHREERGTLNKELANAKKLILEIYGKPNPTIIDTIKSKLARIEKLALPSLELGEIGASVGEISFDEISEDKALIAKLKSNAFTILRYFEKCLSNNIGELNIYVTVDQLDENWLQGEIEEYSKILINLVNVCKHINNVRSSINFNIIIFLRIDIYETLRFNDKNKIFQSNATEIKWDADSLNDMFFQRITKSIPAGVDIVDTRKSNSIFEVEFVRHGATPIKHILRRSFYRPRDIIVYFNKIRDVHGSSKKGLYTSNDLYRAEKEFATSMYNELIDEWANQKPEIEMYLSCLQGIGTLKFNYADFSKQYKKSNSEDDNEGKIKACLDFLFQNSIIGQKPKANWEFVCINPYMAINYSKDFYVNNGLKSRLNIVEKRVVSH